MEMMRQKNAEFSEQLIIAMNEKASQSLFKVIQSFWESWLYILSLKLNIWVIQSLQITITPETDI